jgi:hypothetical protein
MSSRGIPSGKIPSSTAVITLEAPVALKGTLWEAFSIEASSFRPDTDHVFVTAKAVLQSGKFDEARPVRHGRACEKALT